VVTQALVTLRAHRPAPAQVEISYVPLPGRLGRALLALVCCWGALPLVIWIPPHYPWAAVAFVAGLYLSHRQWTGRYRVSYFAGICPRCGHAVSLGVDRCISLPHTLTCYSCHFEPRLEVAFVGATERAPEAGPQHREAGCIGRWESRWLADEPLLVCSHCRASCAATAPAREAAWEENDCADLLDMLTREGRRLL